MRRNSPRWSLGREQIWSRWPNVHIPQFLPMDWTCASPQRRRTSVWLGGTVSSSHGASSVMPTAQRQCVHGTLIEQTSRRRSVVGGQIERRREVMTNVICMGKRGGRATATDYYTGSVGNLLAWVPCEKGKLCYLVTLSSSEFTSSVLSGSHSGPGKKKKKRPHILNICVIFLLLMNHFTFSKELKFDLILALESVKTVRRIRDPTSVHVLFQVFPNPLEWSLKHNDISNGGIVYLSNTGQTILRYLYFILMGFFAQFRRKMLYFSLHNALLKFNAVSVKRDSPSKLFH